MHSLRKSVEVDTTDLMNSEENWSWKTYHLFRKFSEIPQIPYLGIYPSILKVH